MNTYLLVFLGLLLFEAAICTGLKYSWQDTNVGKGWYIPYGDTTNPVWSFSLSLTHYCWRLLAIHILSKSIGPLCKKWLLAAAKIRIIERALLVYMESLLVNITKKNNFEAYVLVESQKMEAYRNYMTIDITTYHSPETFLRSIVILFWPEWTSSANIFLLSWGLITSCSKSTETSRSFFKKMIASFYYFSMPLSTSKCPDI